MFQTPPISDDGLLHDRIRSWSVEKHRLVGAYDRLFSTGMKKKWNTLVYLDLYAGPGRAVVEDTGRLVETSPMIALKMTDPFHRYVFCDSDPQAIDALRTRVERDRPAAAVRFHQGDCNALVAKIIGDIPRYSKTRKVLSLAFLDPRSVRALKFATIRELSNVFVDFIILLALGMDARRNQDQYVHRSDRTIDEFLGDGEWRDEWGREQAQNIPFSRFLATTFAKQMESLGYLAKGRETMREFRSDDNRSLYHIAFFSKSARGYDFWEKALQTASDQRKLSFDP